MTLSYLFASISPWNVWDLTWADWLRFANAADDWTKAQAAGGGDV